MTLALKKATTTKCPHDSGSWNCITISNLVTKCSVIQRILSGQTFTDILNLCCDLDLEHSNLIFHRAIQLMKLYYQIKFGCKPTSSLEDTTEIAIFWLYKPSLWPWHWTQWANFTAWHPGLWCCIIIPGLATKCSVVQKISSEQTFTISLNLRCDLDLESNNPIFHRTLRLLMVCYQTNFGCKRTSNLEDIVKKKIVMFWSYKPSLWP